MAGASYVHPHVLSFTNGTRKAKRSFTAVTDGQLQDVLNKRVLALVESKREARQKHSPQVEMQETAEMVAWTGSIRCRISVGAILSHTFRPLSENQMSMVCRVQLYKWVLQPQLKRLLCSRYRFHAHIYQLTSWPRPMSLLVFYLGSVWMKRAPTCIPMCCPFRTVNKRQTGPSPYRIPTLGILTYTFGLLTRRKKGIVCRV